MWAITKVENCSKVPYNSAKNGSFELVTLHRHRRDSTFRVGARIAIRVGSSPCNLQNFPVLHLFIINFELA